MGVEETGGEEEKARDQQHPGVLWCGIIVCAGVMVSRIWVGEFLDL